MAKTIVLNVAIKVLGSLGSLAIKEVGLGWGLDEELKTLESTLSTIKEVLSYAEEKQVKNHVVKICSNQFKTILAGKLQGRRFILVLDDVCNCDNRDWVKLNFLRHGNKGSKIIVTTHYKSVASTVGTVPMHSLTGLPDDDCRKLVWIWAFHKNDGEQHRNFSEIAKKILEKCDGYPLAIKTLGNLLFMKNDENEWLYLKDKELWELEQNNKHDILPMLRFKYNPLPTDLKRKKELTKSLFELEKMQTVLFPFHAVGASDEGFVDECISRFKYLRVFDLSNSSFQKLPHSIGNLKHLIFLDLSGNANIKTLPNDICKLYNLQTL
ncbi:hypothetical protein ACSBR1_011845 [Camellia fascicularis]